MKKVPFVTKEQVEEIVKTYPTPFHLYDEAGIRANAKAVQEAFAWNKGFREYFAVKATPNPFLISILKEYDECLEFSGIYRSEDTESFRKKLKGRVELCEKILYFYNIAKLDNERLSLLEDLIATGYDKNKIVEIILSAFFSDTPPVDLWHYGDMLYRLKRYKYLPEYIKIASDNRNGCFTFG